MPIARHLLAATAAACLFGGVALAQGNAPAANPAPPSADQPANPAPPASDPAAANPAPTSDQANPAQNAPAAGGSAADTSANVSGGAVQVIASQPVPDTPENRAKYGMPLSHAGKRTKPTGN